MYLVGAKSCGEGKPLSGGKGRHLFRAQMQGDAPGRLCSVQTLPHVWDMFPLAQTRGERETLYKRIH